MVGHQLKSADGRSIQGMFGHLSNLRKLGIRHMHIKFVTDISMSLKLFSVADHFDAWSDKCQSNFKSYNHPCDG